MRNSLPLLGLLLGLLSAPILQAATLWQDTFQEPLRYERLGPAVWRTADGQATFRSGDSESRLVTLLPDLQSATVEADVTLQERSGSSWTYSGLSLYLDTGDSWQLLMVESADGRRYCELIEEYEGVRQAQSAPGPTLLAMRETGALKSWDYGRGYRLTLEISPEGIRGLVTDSATGEFWERDFSFAVGRALKSGRPALMVRGTAGVYTSLTVRGDAQSQGNAVRVERGSAGSAAVIQDEHNAVAPGVVQMLQEGGFGVTSLDWEAVGTQRITPDAVDLLVLADARKVPVTARDALVSYLRAAGKVLAIGAPALSELVVKTPEGWGDQEQWSEAFARRLPAAPIALSPDPWTRNTGNAEGTARIELDASQGPDCWKATVDLLSWETFYANIEGAFGADRRLFVFQAKGDASTPQLSVEFREKDGSRWIASVNLTTNWKTYVLDPREIPYWTDSTSKGRGGQGDAFRPANVSSVAVGLSASHTPLAKKGPHTYWVRSLATASDQSLPKVSFQVPDLEPLCPSYKLYPMESVTTLQAAQEQGIAAADLKTSWAHPCYSPVWRDRGRGLGRDRPWRWIPIVEGLDARGQSRGALVSLLIGNNTLPNALVSNVAVQDPREALSDALRPSVAATAQAMAQGLFLLEGGTDLFSYREGEPVLLGARVINVSRAPRECEVLATVTDAEGKVVARLDQTAQVASGQAKELSTTWRPGAFDRRGYQVSVELRHEGRLADRIAHRIEPLRTAPARPEEFVRVKGDSFTLGGQQWFFKGINYRPNWFAGQQLAPWLSRERYDPEVIERDLTWMQSIGINALTAIQAVQPSDPTDPKLYRDQLDFLDRCERHGMKCYVTVPGGRPYAGGNAATVIDYVRRSGLQNHPAVMSWELAWEPIEKPEALARIAEDWNQWVVERYGSVDSAVRDWGFDPRPEAKGPLPAPTAGQCTNHGAWDRYVAAFRRGFSDLISARYRDIAEPLRSYDPNHLVAFRGGACGIPDGYRFAHIHSVGVAKHMDFLNPEGYNLQQGWATNTPPDEVRKGGLVTLYYRFVSREKPVVWMEFGFTINGYHQVWRPELVHLSPQKLQYQRTEFDSFYSMFIESGARGAAPWWLPGGFRLGENSDFGVLEPDGSERPVCEVLRSYLPRFEQVKHGTPTRILDLDFERNYPVAWKTYAPLYLEAVKEGETPYLRTAGTGSDSANCPLTAVGGVPYSGSNPPVFLNAEFNLLEVKVGAAPWREVASGERITGPAGARVLCRASLGNLGEAKWLAPSAGVQQGRVYLAGRRDYGLQFQAPIAADTEYLADGTVAEFVLIGSLQQETKVSFEMLAQGRAYFGERRTVTLKPAP
jgi:hypothetical protein